ncbi:MAG TPA: hypothetical protein VEC99_16360 [Clostridia bacterium]|nr:hypothetical protein [Clostridia bacterium]
MKTKQVKVFIDSPRLTTTCKGPVHPHVCQCCGEALRLGKGERNLTRWQEHDHQDKPEFRVVALCKTCENRLIEKHPRLYRSLQDNEPWPGCMDLCLDCRYREGVSCRHVDAKANGGKGVAISIARPISAMVDGEKYSGPIHLWQEPAKACKQRIPAGWEPMAAAPKDATDIEVQLEDGSILVAHWAQDLSGEEQPPFIGWFTAVKDSQGNRDGYREIKTPLCWRKMAGVKEATKGTEVTQERH